MIRFWQKKSPDQPETVLSELVIPEKKPFWRRKWLWGIVALFLVLVLIIISSGDNSKEAGPKEELTEEPSPQPSGTQALCPFPDSWSYVSDGPLRTSAGDNLSPWNIVGDPTVLYDQNKFRMWYTAADGRGNGGIALAESNDGITWDIWKKSGSPPGVIDLVLTGTPGAWDEPTVETASVMRSPSGEYRMYYTGNRPPEGSNHYAIGLATSADGINWKKYGNGPIFEPENEWELPTCTNRNDKRSCSNGGVLEPSVLYDQKEKLYKMWYAAVGTKDGILNFRIGGYATSPDGITWKRMLEPVLDRGTDGTWSDALVGHPNVIYDSQSGYHLFYAGVKLSEYCDDCELQRTHIGHAYSVDGKKWQLDERNPILSPRQNKWDAWAIGGPTAIIRNNELFLWYFGNKKSSIDESGIGLVKGLCS